MTKKSHILAALIAAPLSLGHAHDAEAALPDMDKAPALFRDAEVPAIGASGPLRAAVTEPARAACPIPSLDGAELRARVFSMTVDVKWPDGSPMGRLEPEGDGWAFRNTDGTLIARSRETAGENGRTISITGCDGQPVGEITEADAGYGGERAFELKDAAGRVVGRTGRIDYLQSSFKIVGDNRAISIESDHWFLDSWTVRGRGDGRLTAFLITANSAANRRESSARHRDRMGDHPGRSDR